MRLLWLSLVVTCSCTAVTVAPLRPPVDPQAHEVHLVAFTERASGYLVIERVVDSAQHLSMVAVDPKQGSRQTLDHLDAALARAVADPWPGDEALTAALRSNPIGATLERLGYVWPQRLAASGVDTPHGRVELDDRLRILLRDAGEEVVVARLTADPEPEGYAWLLAPHGRQIGVSVRYAGRPRVVDLRVVSLEKAEARLLSARGYDRHLAKDYAAAASLWREALSLDPDAADVTYNLACAMALLELPEQALELLESAIEKGGERYRKMAPDDPDFASLRETGAFDALVEARD